MIDKAKKEKRAKPAKPAEKAEITTNINEIKEFMRNVPEDRKLVADGLFSKLNYLNSIMQKLEKKIDGGDLHIALIKSYNETVQRYGILCKQLVGMLPKTTENSDDPLVNFIKDGSK